MTAATANLPGMKSFTEKFGELVDAFPAPQKLIAAELGQHQSRISKWKLGKEVARLEPRELALIADYFRVPIDYLCRDELDHPTQVRVQSERQFVAGLPEPMRAAWALVVRLGPEAALERLAALPPRPPGKAAGAADPAAEGHPGDPQAPRVQGYATPLKRPDPPPPPDPKTPPDPKAMNGTSPGRPKKSP